MIKPENFGHLHLVYHFTVPLKELPSDCPVRQVQNCPKNEQMNRTLTVLQNAIGQICKQLLY